MLIILALAVGRRALLCERTHAYSCGTLRTRTSTYVYSPDNQSPKNVMALFGHRTTVMLVFLGFAKAPTIYNNNY